MAGLFIACLESVILISSIAILSTVHNAFSICCVSIDSRVCRMYAFGPEPGSNGVIGAQVFNLSMWQRSYQQL